MITYYLQTGEPLVRLSPLVKKFDFNNTTKVCEPTNDFTNPMDLQIIPTFLTRWFSLLKLASFRYFTKIMYLLVTRFIDMTILSE